MNDSEFIQHQHAVVFLRDSTPVRLRPLHAGDKAELARAFDKLSPQSRYRRFFSPLHELSLEMIAYLSEIDYVNHFAWGAFALAEADTPLIGVARYIRLRDEPRSADTAIAVIDKFHRRGLGRLLLRALVEAAVKNDIQHLVGNTHLENRPILRLLRQAKAQIVPAHSGTLHFTVDLAVVRDELGDSDVIETTMIDLETTRRCLYD